MNYYDAILEPDTAQEMANYIGTAIVCPVEIDGQGDRPCGHAKWFRWVERNGQRQLVATIHYDPARWYGPHLLEGCSMYAGPFKIKGPLV